MSRRNKLFKFSQILSFPNVFENYNAGEPRLVGENGVEVDLKGKWAEQHFKNSNPLTLELACGKGEYTVGLAQRFPERNFIGVDVKGARIWRGAKTALEAGITNAAFVRTRIEQLAMFFEKDEVSEIWITFPDPFLNNAKANRRLTSLPFLAEYQKVLKPGGLVHLKTDDESLYLFTLDVLTKQKEYALLFHDNDIYAKPMPMPELEIKTFYEKQHLAAGKAIKFVRFRRGEL